MRIARASQPLLVLSTTRHSGGTPPAALRRCERTQPPETGYRNPRAQASASAEGAARLTPRDAYLRQPLDGPFALQAGPFLVDPGAKFGMRSRDRHAHRRTVIVRTAADELKLLVTSPVTLYDLAGLLLDRPALGFAAERALNLDGGPSTGLYGETAGGRLADEPRWPARNLIGIRLTKP